MKIFKDGKVYVQVYDVAQMNNSIIPYPSSINPERFDECKDTIRSTRGKQFLVFEKPLEVKYFEMIDWIINYDDVKDKTIEELQALSNNLIEQQNNSYKEFKKLSNEEKKKKSLEYSYKLDTLEHQTYTLLYLILHKQNKMEIELPFDSEDNKKKIKQKAKTPKEVK